MRRTESTDDENESRMLARDRFFATDRLSVVPECELYDDGRSAGEGGTDELRRVIEAVEVDDVEKHDWNEKADETESTDVLDELRAASRGRSPGDGDGGRRRRRAVVGA